jgi:hypothetical protein
VLTALMLLPLGCPKGWQVHTARMISPPKGRQLEAAPDDIVWMQFAARLPKKTKGGVSWDDDGGKPDPYLVVYADGEELFRTKPVDDVTEVEWPDARGNFSIATGAELKVLVFDADTTSDQPMGQGSLGKPSRIDAANGSMRTSLGGTSSLTLTLGKPRAWFGLGFSYEIQGDETHVVTAFAHGPAGRAGMKSGDQIVSVSGKKLSSMLPDEVHRMFDGLPTNPLDIVVKHKGATTEALKVSVGAIYPLYVEMGPPPVADEVAR